MRQVEQLRENGRINYFAEADYRKDSTACMWIKGKITEFATRIIQEEKNRQLVKDNSPRHLIN